MLLVGLTGGIGSGKSTVARALAHRGAVVVDADEIARAVVEPGTPAWRKLVEHFGDMILHEDRTLHREVLAQLVFGDPGKVALLNEITHPPIMRAIADQLEILRGTDEVVILDAPLLVEAGGASGCDVLIVVTAPEDVRLARLRRDRGMSEEAARSRMASQTPEERKIEMADVVVRNDGSPEDLEAKVEDLWSRLVARRAANSGGAGRP